MELKKKINQYLFYLDSYISMWRKLESWILQSHEILHYQKIFCKDSLLLDEIIELNSKVDIIDNLSLKSIASFNSEIEARSEALGLISNYSRLIKEKLSLSTYECYDSENNLINGIFSKNGDFVTGLQITIFQLKDKWVVESLYFPTIIEVINEYLLENKIIDSDIAPHKYSAIIFENDVESHHVYNELQKRYQLIEVDNNLKAKEKFDYLEKIGCPFIFVIRKKGNIRLKIVFLDQEVDCSLESIDKILNEYQLQIKQNLINLSLENNLNYINEKKIFICKECLNKRKEKQYLKPFNQRVIHQKCSICSREAEILIINL